jgi:hypothetical protein
MSGADIFAQMGTKPKSYGDFRQEIDAQNANALALKMNGLGYQNALQAQQEDAAYKEAAKGFGADSAANYNALLQAGLPKQAMALQKSALDAQKTQAEVGHLGAQTANQNAQAGKNKLEAATAKLGYGQKVLQSASTPQQVAQMMLMGVQNGTFTEGEAKQFLDGMPSDPGQFQQWQQQQAMKGMEIGKRLELQLKKTEEERKTANEKLIPDGKGGWMINEPLVSANARIAQAGAPVTYGSPVAMQMPGSDSPVMVQPGNRPGAPPQIMKAPGTDTPLRPAKDPNAGPKISSEVQRQIGGVTAFDKDLSALEEALKDFDPRSMDQFNTTKRAKIQSIAKQAQLSAKEAAALGALSGPDMMLLEGILNDPTSRKGAVAGSAGIAAQIKEARAGNARRVESLKEQYGEKATSGIKVKGPATGAIPADINDLLKKYGGNGNP